jgi:hypothetical protein
MICYVIDAEGNVVRAGEAEWRLWYGRDDRRILAYDETDNARVSTIFIGLNDVIWETVIFGGPHHGHQVRYATREEALAGHQHALWLAENPNTTTDDDANEWPRVATTPDVPRGMFWNHEGTLMIGYWDLLDAYEELKRKHDRARDSQ